MKRTAILVGLLTVLGSIPAVSTAEHLSVGAEDAVATESTADETPNDPSVVGRTVGDKSTPYGLGTSTDCYSPEGDASVEEADQARQADGLCGELVYHEGKQVEVESNPDQDLRDPITRWDVVRDRTWTDFLILEQCTVFCSDQPGGDTAWNTVHDTGNQVGLTHDGDTADGKNDNREQAYEVYASYPTASRLVQDTTGIWRMNGWLAPGAMHQFVGYLESNGDPVNETELTDLVDAKTPGDLDPNTAPAVCGYSADVEFQGGGIQAACEIPFSFRAPGGTEADFRDGYNDRCQSPTYVCGAVNGPAWFSGAIGFPGYANPTVPGLGGEIFVGDENQLDYMKWHFVVAPHNSACNGGQEPGFSFDGDGASNPYLAHDVDVFTPVTDAQGVPNGAATSEVSDFGNAIVANAGDEAVDAVGEAVSSIPGLPSQVSDTVNETVDTAVNATFFVLKTDRTEPNNAEPVGSIDDTSQHLLPDSDLERSLGGKCAIFDTSETADTVDPWVDRVDSQANLYPTSDAALGLYDASTVGVYGNQDTNQDGSNNPTPSAFYSSGQVGMFTDKDDDGEYEPIGDATQKYEGQDIGSVGAYPMLWDMHLTPEGEIEASSGCQIGDDTITTKMDQAGYTAHTGLAQAVYLQEPTAFFTSGGLGGGAADQVSPYPVGNNIYLLLSDSAKELYVPDGGHIGGLSPSQVNPTADAVQDGNPVDSAIDDLVENLRAYADDKNGEAQGPPTVRVPGNELGLDSDFNDQCGEETGGFTSTPNWLHQCETGCSGDTVVTMYSFDLDKPTVGGGESDIPLFTGATTTGYSFGTGQHTWYDVDPFDGEPDRNTDESSAPPE